MLRRRRGISRDRQERFGIVEMDHEGIGVALEGVGPEGQCVLVGVRASESQN